MSLYPDATQHYLNKISKLAEQRKNQRALKIKNRNFKQILDIKLAENLSPITKKLDTIKENTKKLGEKVEKPDVEHGKTQTWAIENITGT